MRDFKRDFKGELKKVYKIAYKIALKSELKRELKRKLKRKPVNKRTTSGGKLIAEFANAESILASNYFEARIDSRFKSLRSKNQFLLWSQRANQQHQK